MKAGLTDIKEDRAEVKLYRMFVYGDRLHVHGQIACTRTDKGSVQEETQVYRKTADVHGDNTRK